LLLGIQFVLVDSIGMLVAKDEEDKSNEDSEKMAAEARALGRFIKRANAFMSNDSLIVLINQYRANLNKMGNAPDKKAYGARIVQYANKLTIELRRVKQEQDRDHIEAFVQKNKVGGRKGLKVEFQIVSTEGIDYAQHTLDLALEFGIVEQRGAWYYFPSYAKPEVRAQGAERAKAELPMDVITEAVHAYITSTGEDSEQDN
jgi:recombination protein RecA